MTTASLATNRNNSLPGDPFQFGAGHADVAAALDPGLTYDAGEADFLRYECASALLRAPVYNDYGRQTGWAKAAAPAYCKELCRLKSCAAPAGFYDVNVPSFSLNGLARNVRATARRRLTFVGAGAYQGPTTFNAALELPAGYSGRVVGVESGGATLTFGRGSGPKEFVLEITPNRAAPLAPLKAWSFGALTWTDAGGRWQVRSAIALRRTR